MEPDTQVPAPADPSVEDTSAPAVQDEASPQSEVAPEAAPVDENTDVNATDTVAEKLLAGKYKSPEDLEKAYKELESKFGQTASEKAELSKILSEAFASEPTPATSQPQVTDEYEDYPATNQPSNQNDGVTRDLALIKFSMGHPDADGSSMVKILQSDPNIKDISSYEAKLNYAYAISKAQSQPKAVEQAQKQAQVETQVKIAEKQAAQVESVTKQSPATDSNQPLTPHEIRSTVSDDKAFNELLKKQFPGISNMLAK